ncbi:hypothetical protein [Vibrio lentus]|uniref:hypothetical protein n=1 Tax=Vibrio lentus TaxID=136468 RepID=UPI0012FFF73E|nr:hypothetical protein [Vibrio lentus]
MTKSKEMCPQKKQKMVNLFIGLLSKPDLGLAGLENNLKAQYPSNLIVQFTK